MKKIISLFLTAIVCLSFSVGAFAEPVDTVSSAESITLPTEEAGTGEIVAEATPATTVEVTTVAPESPSEVSGVDAIVVSGYGLVAMTLNGVKTTVTITVESNGKSYELVFSAENNYIVQESLPVGEYTIVSAESSSDDYKIKDCLTDRGEAKFTVEETDFMTVIFQATESRIPFIVGFLKREWYLLLVLVALVVAYVYRRKARVLPSQEH